MDYHQLKASAEAFVGTVRGIHLCGLPGTGPGPMWAVRGRGPAKQEIGLSVRGPSNTTAHPPPALAMPIPAHVWRGNCFAFQGGIPATGGLLAPGPSLQPAVKGGEAAGEGTLDRRRKPDRRPSPPGESLPTSIIPTRESEPSDPLIVSHPGEKRVTRVSSSISSQGGRTISRRGPPPAGAGSPGNGSSRRSCPGCGPGASAGPPGRRSSSRRRAPGATPGTPGWS